MGLFLGFLIQGILLLYFFYLVGALLLWVFRIGSQKPYLGTFLKILLGSVTFTSLVAFYFTQSRTIFICIIPLGVFILTSINTNKKSGGLNGLINALKIRSTPFVEANLVFLAILAYRFLFFDQDLGFPITLFHDHLFYSKLSFYLSSQGIENPFLNYLYPTPVAPYHYFMLWLNSGISYLINAQNHGTLIAITYSLLISLTWLGVMALIEFYGKDSWPFKLGAFGSLFIGPFYHSFFENISLLKYSGTFDTFPVNQPKFIIIHLILICAFLAALHNKDQLGLYILAALVMVYTPLLPVLLLFFALLLILKFTGRIRIQIQIWRLIFLGVVLAFVLGGLYIPGLDQTVIIPSLQPQKGFDIFNHLRTSINIVGGTILQLLILFIPLWLTAGLLIYFKNFKPTLQHLSGLIPGLLITSSLLVWAIFHHFTNSVQFFSAIAIPVFWLLTIVSAINLFPIRNPRVNIWAMVLVSAFVVFNVFKDINNTNRVKDSYLARFSSSFRSDLPKKLENLAPLGVFLKDSSEYSSHFKMFHNYETLDLRLHNLRTPPGWHTISLSVFEASPNPSSPLYQGEMALIEKSEFNQFVKKWGSDGKKEEIPFLQKEFIEKHQIDFVLASRAAEIREPLSSFLTLSLTDSTSGIRLYLINKQLP